VNSGRKLSLHVAELSQRDRAAACSGREGLIEIISVEDDILHETLSVPENQKNSSGDEIANVNFLYDDIVHAVQNTNTKCNRLVHGFRHRSTRLRVGTHVYQIQQNNAI